jgi:MoaA/NifB/PqqE/SkfB family radical SAM enzyme
MGAQRSSVDPILRECAARCQAHGILTTFPALFYPDPTSELPVSRRPQSEPPLLCYAPWRMMRIKWNGEVQPCDLWGQGGIGDFRTQSFEEMWTSPDYVRLRWDHVRRLPTHPSAQW